MLFHCPHDLIVFFGAVDFAAASKFLVIEILTACYTIHLQSCIIAIRPSENLTINLSVVAYNLNPQSRSFILYEYLEYC